MASMAVTHVRASVFPKAVFPGLLLPYEGFRGATYSLDVSEMGQSAHKLAAR